MAPGTPSDDDAVVDEDLVTRAGRMYLSRFAWIDGHADPWAPLRDPQPLTLIIDALAHLVVSLNPTVVLSIEARGFLYGPAVASRAGMGFTAVRKAHGPFPGSLIEAESPADYRGNRHRLRLRRDDLRPGDRVVLVDDWIETGSQAITAMRMAEQAGGRWAGCDRDRRPVDRADPNGGGSGAFVRRRIGPSGDRRPPKFRRRLSTFRHRCHGLVRMTSCWVARVIAT